MKLFFSELKKFFGIKGIGISIILIIMCMFLNTINNAGLLNKYKKGIESGDGEDTTKYENKLLDAHTGIIFSEEKYKEMLLVSNSLYVGTDSEGEEPGRFGPAKKYDKWLYETLLATMTYLGEFKDSLSDVIYNAEQVKENNKYLGEYSDTYKDKEADAVISAYTRIRENTKLKLANTRGAYMYCWSESEGINQFNYQLLIIFLCCIISIYFTSEYEGGMHQLTYTAYKGRIYFFVLKNRIVFVATLFLTLLSCMIDAVIMEWRFGGFFGAFSQPIQLVYFFPNGAIAQFCPFNITFGQYVLLVFFMKFTALYFVANISAWMAVWLRNAMASIVASVLAGVGLLQFTIYTAQMDLNLYEQKSIFLDKIFIWLKTYSPISLLWLQDYTRSYDAINLFGMPVHRLYFVLTFAWLLIVSVLIINSCLYCRRGCSSETGIIKYIKKIWQNRSLA
ncbi:MAG: hypothetical protein HDT40_10820 [Lachnospiraceae bacterium]|nr:hypothetical protein [Lachnospiraceae bacterium]